MITEISKHPKIARYREGQCRNDPRAKSHTYAEDHKGNLLPMCGYGWNRTDGYGFSIFRGTYGSEGDCKICRRNLREGKPPKKQGIERKTRWI